MCPAMTGLHVCGREVLSIKKQDGLLKVTRARALICLRLYFVIQSMHFTSR